MQNGLFKGARRIRKITDKLRDSPTKYVSDDELIKDMRLEKFIKEYVHRHEMGIRLVERASFRGRGINKKSMVAVGWGNLVSSKSQRIDWKLLGGLYDWLWERVVDYSFYSEMKPVAGMEEYLRHQYNAHRWLGGALKYLIKKLKIGKNEIPGFWENFFIQNWAGSEQAYFGGKLPISEDSFRRLFLNATIETFLIGAEGLTLLAKDQSFADPGFAFMFVWLYKNVGKVPGLQPEEENRANKILFADAQMPYEGSQIDEYFSYALKLYLDHNQEIGNLPALVIFPDKSYFSTAF
jgi:hypothetical protein